MRARRVGARGVVVLERPWPAGACASCCCPLVSPREEASQERAAGAGAQSAISVAHSYRHATPARACSSCRPVGGSTRAPEAAPRLQRPAAPDPQRAPAATQQQQQQHTAQQAAQQAFAWPERLDQPQARPIESEMYVYVHGIRYQKLDLAGKGGSSKVYKVRLAMQLSTCRRAYVHRTDRHTYSLLHVNTPCRAAAV